MKLMLATALFAVCIGAATARADDGLSKQDIKLVLEWAKSPGIRMPPGVDTATGEVKVTNAARSVMQAAMEQLAVENGAFVDFTKACGVKPKVVYDMAVILVNAGSRYDYDSFWAAFANVCTNPPDAVKTAFVRKFKTIHFTLGALRGKAIVKDSLAIPWAFAKLDAKTGELTIGYAPLGTQNLGDGVRDWIAVQ
jgi:hypothetical protein